MIKDHSILRGLKALLGRKYHYLNSVELSVPALKSNYTYLSSLHKGVAIAPVLKSNAYGHGIREVARVLDPLGAPFFCVDSLAEAYELSKIGIKTPILIMGYVSPSSLAVKRLPFSYAVFTQDQLMAVAKYQPHAPIHLFVDTGMHREGVPLAQFPEFVAQAAALKLHLEGLMSHLALAHEPQSKDTRKQVEAFRDARKICTQAGVTPRYEHLLASSGLLHASEYLDVGNVARVGIALYGVDPEGRNSHLRPVLELKTTIAQIKDIPAGAKVGYDFTFTAKKKMRLAVLPIGYNDGVDRRLSNLGRVSIAEKTCPIVGRVSMNITLVDITNAGEEIREGNPAVIYTNSPGSGTSLLSASRLSRTIPYELMVHLDSSIRRNMVYSKP